MEELEHLAGLEIIVFFQKLAQSVASIRKQYC